ncbi:MAG: hypothetical protein E7K04_04515 [Helicobacter sp.]|nr:hypothetical protein [Helicobacter sp.]
MTKMQKALAIGAIFNGSGVALGSILSPNIKFFVSFELSFICFCLMSYLSYKRAFVILHDISKKAQEAEGTQETEEAEESIKKQGRLIGFKLLFNARMLLFYLIFCVLLFGLFYVQHFSALGFILGLFLASISIVCVLILRMFYEKF